MVFRNWLLVLFSFSVLWFSGCASIGLEMKAAKEPINESVYSSKIKTESLSKIMVLPPSGTSRGLFEPRMVLFEKGFLNRFGNLNRGLIATGDCFITDK